MTENMHIEILYKLQQLDTELKRLESEEKDFPKLIEKTEQEIEKAKKDIEVKRDHLKKMQVKQKELEGELKEQERKISDTKDKMFAVKTNQEYHALQKELEMMRNRKDEIEDSILLLLDELDAAEKDLRRGEKNFMVFEAQKGNEIARLKSELEHIPKKIEQLQKERELLKSKLPADLVDQYEHLLLHRAGVSVVKVINGVCQGCNMAIPPQLYNLILRNERVYSCPNCQRILYPAELKDSEKE